MNKNELMNIYGGVSFSATMVSALVKGVTSIYEIGRRVGSYLIRYTTNNLCSVK